MLIPDWETDCVAVVRPRAEWQYGRGVDALYAKFIAAIEAHDAVQVIDDPGLDIWIRDFAPFQTDGGRWVAGIYQPSYLEELQSARITAAFACHCMFDRFPVRLDGGAFVHNGRGIGIVTKKLYHTNRERSCEQLIRLLKKHLELDHLVVIPSVPGDRTGHVDGIARWADEETLLVGREEYESVIPALRAGLPHGTEIVPFPQVICDEVINGLPCAHGIYVNFLLTRNAVYLPVFGLPEDWEAIATAERIFAGKPVVPINAYAVAVHGGALNCISWNFTSGLTASASGA
ncbi:MAG: agmatine deiminase family protein [Stellaceae bacterium]